MKKKKLMILGGLAYIIPVIEKAHELGIYVITCDYLKDNIAHRYSDQYVYVSVIDQDAVLRIAEELHIDGIISFACDPGVVTAAYVAEKMGLPFQGSYESTRILQNKGLFRAFLEKNGFTVPHAKGYTAMDDPWKDREEFHWPVIVKPADSAGSKGVQKVETAEALPAAVEEALAHSIKKEYIIEDFIELQGSRSDTDMFLVNGKLCFSPFSNQFFDLNADNPYVPAGVFWPSTMPENYQEAIRKEIQRLMDLLQMKNGIFNIETCVDKNGRTYIMEVSPRGGGGGIAELQSMAYGVDLIGMEVKRAVGEPIEEIENVPCDGIWCDYIMHANLPESMTLKKVWLEEEVSQKYLQKIYHTHFPGDEIAPFSAANKAIGNFFLKSSDRQKLEELMGRITEWFHVEVEKDQN